MRLPSPGFASTNATTNQQTLKTKIFNEKNFTLSWRAVHNNERRDGTGSHFNSDDFRYPCKIDINTGAIACDKS
jgi:hypothetical protein